MNIFLLDTDPHKAAEYHCDQHVSKMIIEVAQTLSLMVMHKDPGMCKPPTQGHPFWTWHGVDLWAPKDKVLTGTEFSSWASDRYSNTEWLCQLGHGLNYQHEVRWHKPAYMSHQIIRSITERLEFLHFPRLLPTDFPMVVTPAISALDLGPITSYRLYYASTKRNFASWKRLGKDPYWWADACQHTEALGLTRPPFAAKKAIS